MRLMMIMGVLLVFTMLAPPAVAQSTPPVVVASETGIMGMTRGQVVAIAAGAVVGSIVVHAFVPGDFTALIGGIGGGLLADWWYNNGGSDTLRASIRYAPQEVKNQPVARMREASMTR